MWAAIEAARLREGIEGGAFDFPCVAQRDAEVLEAIAADYRARGDKAALVGLGPRQELPEFLRPQGNCPACPSRSPA